MSLWYDIKNKVYSSGPMDNWYITHLKKCCDTLTETIQSIFTRHTNGTADRHRSDQIDFEDGITVKDAIDNESIARVNGDRDLSLAITNLAASEKTAREEGLALKVDKEDGKQLSSNDYTDEEKNILSKTAGKKTEGTKYSNITLQSNGEIKLTETSTVCKEGSEIFNDYSSNQAAGFYSHAEGQYTTAYGDYSHAEGVLTSAKRQCSHAEGENTIAASRNQHVQGMLNIKDESNTYAHIIGNGHYEVNSNYQEIPVRSNAHTIDWNGNGWFAGDVFCGDTERGLQSQINDLYNLRPTVLTETSNTLTVNTIYDLGLCTELTLNVPDGSVGDWIKVDFISGETAAEVSISANSICNYSIIPEPNTIYSLYFDWGRLSENSYGWRFAYSEYTKAVTQ